LFSSNIALQCNNAKKMNDPVKVKLQIIARRDILLRQEIRKFVTGEVLPLLGFSDCGASLAPACSRAAG